MFPLSQANSQASPQAITPRTATPPEPLSAARADGFMPEASQPLGQMAVALPGATAVFRRLKLDFCCGGQQSLAQACAERGLPRPSVLCRVVAARPDAQPGRGSAGPRGRAGTARGTDR